VDGVIALADAEAVAGGRFAPNVDAVRTQQEADDSLDHETPLSEVFEDQMACADIILLTKTDLASPDAIVAAKSVIKKETPRPLPIVEVAEGVVDPRVILGLGAAAEDDLLARPSHNDEAHDHDHEDFDSIVVELGEVDNPEALGAKIVRVAREQNILRVKGYAAVKRKPMRLLFQAVGSRVRAQYDRPWKAEEPRRGRLVVIAEHDDISRDRIEAVLKG
jgi:cobalamin biosynthesis protein CobW